MPRSGGAGGHEGHGGPSAPAETDGGAPDAAPASLETVLTVAEQ
ncbi:MAG: hypothetical protein ACRDQ7_01835 [Haloechinothrix sp.]